jgi:hypothetical protein
VKQLSFYHLNKGQVIFIIVGLVLTLFVFLVIILGNITTSSFQFASTFKGFISLRSLAISGLRYALYQINQNPNFTTSSAKINMPQGSFIYSVTSTGITTRKIDVQANLTSPSLSKILSATATIDSTGKIIDLEVEEK